MKTIEDLDKKLRYFADKGLTVSICCGHPRHPENYVYSVDIMYNNKLREGPPFAAHSLLHCIEIVETEAKENGVEL